MSELQSSQPDAIYDTFVEEPLFFSFRKSQKRTIRMRVYQSSWSSPAFIDIAGCSVLILCRYKPLYWISIEYCLKIPDNKFHLVISKKYFIKDTSN